MLIFYFTSSKTPITLIVYILRNKCVHIIVWNWVFILETIFFSKGYIIKDIYSTFVRKREKIYIVHNLNNIFYSKIWILHMSLVKSRD